MGARHISDCAAGIAHQKRFTTGDQRSEEDYCSIIASGDCRNRPLVFAGTGGEEMFLFHLNWQNAFGLLG